MDTRNVGLVRNRKLLLILPCTRLSHKGEKIMNAVELKSIIAAHALWLEDKSKGKRADLSNANLQEADLHGADLRGADLRGAVLSNVNRLENVRPRVINIPRDFKKYKGCGYALGAFPSDGQLADLMYLNEIDDTIDPESLKDATEMATKNPKVLLEIKKLESLGTVRIGMVSCTVRIGMASCYEFNY